MDLSKRSIKTIKLYLSTLVAPMTLIISMLRFLLNSSSHENVTSVSTLENRHLTLPSLLSLFFIAPLGRWGVWRPLGHRRKLQIHPGWLNSRSCTKAWGWVYFGFIPTTTVQCVTDLLSNFSPESKQLLQSDWWRSTNQFLPLQLWLQNAGHSILVAAFLLLLQRCCSNNWLTQKLMLNLTKLSVVFIISNIKLTFKKKKKASDAHQGFCLYHFFW